MFLFFSSTNFNFVVLLFPLSRSSFSFFLFLFYIILLANLCIKSLWLIIDDCVWKIWWNLHTVKLGIEMVLGPQWNRGVNHSLKMWTRFSKIVYEISGELFATRVEWSTMTFFRWFKHKTMTNARQKLGYFLEFISKFCILKGNLVIFLQKSIAYFKRALFEVLMYMIFFP